MPTAVRSASTPSTISSGTGRRSDFNAFATIAMFSAIGLLASLIAILCGVPAAWF
jgi:hypothetical protein